MTNREVIRSKVKEENGILKPIRTDKELKQALKSRSVLDQEYVENKEVGDYRTISIDKLNVAVGTNPEVAEDALDVDTIRHTDVIEIEGQKHNVVAAKTTSEILDQMLDGKFQSMGYYVNYSNADSTTVEGRIKNLKPTPIDLPKGRKGVNVQDGMIIASPNINGLKVVTLAEQFDDISYAELVVAVDAMDNLQGYLLEKTLIALNKNGVSVEELLRSQASVGLVKNARRSYERASALEASGDGSILITNEIRNKSRAFADNLNEELQLLPLTGETLEIGFQVFTVEVSTSAARKAQWTSSRSNLSYFDKGKAQGRIERIVGNKRRIPIINELVPESKELAIDFTHRILPIMENATRRQLGLTPLPYKVQFPANIKPTHKSIIDLFDIDPAHAHKVAANMATQANKAVKAAIQGQHVKTIETILSRAYATLNQADKEKSASSDITPESPAKEDKQSD